MNNILAGAFADAAALWRRDRDLLVRVAGVFFFLPALAGELFLAKPEVSEDAGEAWRQLTAFFAENAHWLIASYATQLFGIATILALLLDADRPALGEAMKRGAALFPVFLLSLILTGMLFGLGFFLFVIPALYIAGRTLVIGAVVVAEKQHNPILAVARSFVLTRKRGWLCFLMTAMVLVIGMAATSVASELSSLLGDGPVASALEGAVVAAIAAALTVANVLVQVGAYRRLTDPSSGT